MNSHRNTSAVKHSGVISVTISTDLTQTETRANTDKFKDDTEEQEVLHEKGADTFQHIMAHSTDREVSGGWEGGEV